MTHTATRRRHVLEIFEQALQAVAGDRCVREYLCTHSLPEPIYLVALGKAAPAMARGAHEALGERIRDGLVVTKYGHAEPLPWPVLEAGHPVPDAASLAAGQAVHDFASALPPQATVLVLVSGGASALCELLPSGVSFEEWKAVNRWLLASGLDIHAMNAVRKRLSRLKGGRLATLLAPRRVLALAISDVPGDDPRAIASGPLVAEPVTRLDPEGLPDFVRVALAHAPPMPATSDPCFEHVRFEIVATLESAKQAAAHAARARGYEPVVARGFVGGDALEAGTRLARELLNSTFGTLYVWGGETTLALPATPGRGGRNQSLALAAAIVLAGSDGVLFLAAGTDGTDGPTPDAGALVDGGTIARGTALGLTAERALAAADAGTFLAASGDLIHTGPTGTNVMDLMLGLRYR